jgi:zinc protease
MGEEDFARIRDQVENELTADLRGADDEELGKEALHALMYEGHPYAHPVLGDEAALARIRVDDARAHRSQVFCAGRAIVGVAGDLPEGFEQRVQRDVATLSSDACVGREVLPEAASAGAPRMLIVDKPSAQSVAVSMGMPIDVERDDPDYPALVLAAAWLGQHRQFVGVLMQEIRGQRGLNYGDYAYAEHFTQEGWSRFPIANDARRQQYFSIWLRPLRPETAHFAIRLAVRRLRQLYEHGLSQAELDRIRTFAGAYYALYLQTSSRRLGFAMDDAFYGVDRPYLERLRASWAALTPDQVNAAIRRHLSPEHLQLALVASDASALADRIASEAESPVTYRSSVPERVTAEEREIVGYHLGIPRDRIRIVRVDRMFAE